jgi:5'-3' exonuclease
MKIQWRWVSKFISELAKSEHNRIMQEYEMRERLEKWKFSENTSKEREAAFNNMPILYRAEERYICPNEKFWETRYYRSLFRQSHSRELVKEITTNYLEGLEWTFKYYTNECPDWKWKYNYHYPPLLNDLAKYVPIGHHEYIVSNTNRAFSPNTQLAYVLPKESLDLLSEKNREYLLTNDSHLYVDVPEFQWAFCRYFWESHAVLPEIPIEKLNQWESILD